MMMEERRKFVRLDLNTEVKWERIPALEQQEKAVSVGNTKNISGGGICLIIEDIVKVGDSLSLEITLPTKEVVSCEGRVVWVSEYEIIGGKREMRYDAGIEFSKISNEDRENIKKFVFKYLKAGSS